MVKQVTSTDHIDDIEIVADVVRYARAATPGTKAKSIFRQVRLNHPDVDESRIRRACQKAADLLLAQHS